ITALHDAIERGRRLREVLLELRAERAGGEDEHARVPGVLLPGEVALGDVPLRLLLEGLDLEDPQGERVALPYVAVGFGGERRGNPEGDDRPLARPLGRPRETAAELLRRVDRVVARQDGEYGVVACLLGHGPRRPANGGRRVAGRRLREDARDPGELRR